MNLNVNIVNNQNIYDFDYEGFIIKLLNFASEYLKIEKEYELSIILCDDTYIHNINKEYRNKDYATDVLSFAVLEWEEDSLELGDIFISIEKVISQAKEYSHSFDRELGFLTIHGFLHLLGYDHEEEKDEITMFKLQDEILNAYNLKR